MKIRGLEKTNLESSIRSNFIDYKIESNAPQGQNVFSCNYILEKNSQKYLLKVLLKGKIKGQINRDQALSEVMVYKTVNSHYILPISETKQNNDYIFLLLPFLEGQNMAEYVKDRVLSEDEIVEIGISILRGISDLWRKKIVHQDLKPENIFIEKTGAVKILDFGSARFGVSPFRGSARTNFAYSSPEQILASRPGNAERLRITLDDRIDVYAVGLILYLLIEGHHPFSGFTPPAEAIFSGETIPPIVRTDISIDLKRVVMRMLDTNQLNRPNSQVAINFIETKKIVAPELPNGGFYYCAINGLNRFLSIKASTPDLFDGVIIEASQVPKEEGDRIQIRKNIKTVLIDPQSYLFQCPKHQLSKFKKLPYFKYNTIFNDYSEMLEKIKNKDSEIVSFINDTIEYQSKSGATALIPPFLYINEINNDTWSIDQEISMLSLELLNKYKLIKPFVKGVVIAQGILTSKHSRNRLLEYLTSLSDQIEGYMVLLETSHSDNISDESWLEGAQDLFIKLLSTGKYVIWSKADFSSLALAPIGISVAIGDALKQRRFNVIEDKNNFARKVHHFYVPQLFARATWPEMFRALSGYEKVSDFFCSGSCCPSVDFSSPSDREEGDLARHMMNSFGNQFKKYNSRGGKASLIRDIKKAKQYYESLKNHSSIIIKQALKKNVIKPSSGGFLESWLNTLDR